MNNPISALFGPSPIRPIQEHMAKAQSCIALLGDFLEASFSKNWKEAEEIQQAIHKKENEADTLKREIRTHLPRSLWLPVARNDLLEMLHIQDHLANRARDIAGIMLGRKIEIPEELVECVRDYYQKNLNTSAQALKAINELDELLETGFRGREATLVEELVVELDELEHQSDVSQIKLRAMLFQMEDSLPPVHVMFLYKIIDRLGELADISQKVGSRLLLLIAK
jgi:predicted phosphate transport protein (TIGR00153 family)|tara:strand:+ start:302 stop:976 length:675 start_codon:yes stop_codon:yes gene_type:complete